MLSDEDKAHPRPRATSRAARSGFHDVERVLAASTLHAQIADGGWQPRIALQMVAVRAQEATGADGVVLKVSDGDKRRRPVNVGCGDQRLIARSPMVTVMSRRALQTGEVQWWMDTDPDARPTSTASRARARAIVCTPWRHRGAAAGVLAVVSSERAAFDGTDITVLGVLASAVTTVLTRADLAAEVQRNVTARRHAEDALGASNDNFRRLFYDNPQAMWVVDADTRKFLAVNSAALRQYGYSAAEFASLTITDLRVDADPAVLADLAHARAGVFQFAARHRLRDGRVIDVEVATRGQEFGGRPAVLSLLQDVTQRLALEREMTRRSFHDPLTNLPNRELFMDRLRHALRRRPGRAGTAVAVLFIDVDRFKTINDEVGHAVGDAVLRALADRLATVIRPDDTLTRLGGDEFGILVDGVADPRDARRSAQRILDVCADPVEVDGHSIPITLSVGVAVSKTRGSHAEELLRDAELAMYAAKSRGRAHLELFTVSMRTAAVEGLSLDQDLRHAMQRNELRLLFQPVVAVASGEVIGCEALVRWQHPTRGLLSPDIFIPMAEETGLITVVDTWVIHQACAQMAAWREAGMVDLSVAVNASGIDIGCSRLTERVESALADSGIPPHCLEIELTERVAATQSAAALRELATLRKRGVKVSIDDFGTGYSSLSKLATLSLDRLKIDRSFLASITTADDKVPLVSATIALAHELGLSVIAEGVETAGQLAFLKRYRCDLFQGYLVSPPVNAQEFTRIYARCARPGAGANPAIRRRRGTSSTIASRDGSSYSGVLRVSAARMSGRK